MKLSKILFALTGIISGYSANAADITIFHSPTCPHCKHAREFIENTLIYEYETLKVDEVNVMNVDNRQAFVDALYKCGYNKGGVPVIVVGEKCFQGYADSMQSDLRAAVEADLTAEQKTAAAANKTALEQNKDAFITAHADRKNAVFDKDAQKKTN